jgi:carboxyl-terminal processing protease
VACARRFLTSGIIVRTKNREDTVTDHMVRNGGMVVPLTREEVPMVVLIDRYTESSAEVLAAALKENDRAKLIGQTTFGKACSQKFFSFKVGKDKKILGAMCVTVEKFISPKTGESYHGRGIVPDDTLDSEDEQLSRAREVIKEEIKKIIDSMPQPMQPMKMPSMQ